MRRVLFRVTFVVAVAMCVLTMSLWIWSQWTFARVTCSYVTDASNPFKQKQVVLLIWRDAAEVIVRNEAYHPGDEAARARLRLDLPRARHVDIYNQRGVSTSEDGDPDAANHWGFWYRSPEES